MLSQNGELDPSEDEDEVEAALYDKTNVSSKPQGINLYLYIAIKDN